MSRSVQAARKEARKGRAATGHLRRLSGGLSGGMPDLDRLIHERIRLGIVSALASSPSLSFSELKELLQASDGNLSRHAQKLEEAGYIACRKSFQGRKPLTEYRLTDAGRRALESYLDHMEAVIRAARGAGD